MTLYKLYTAIYRQRSVAAFGAVGQKLRFQTTAAATGNVAPKPEDNDIEWEKARPMEEMPTIKAFNLLKNYFPGGKYYKKDSKDVMKLLGEEYGSTYYLPEMFGRAPLVVTNNPFDFERVYRNEGVWPTRPGSETLRYHRSKHSADFYQGVEGLISTKGEQWGKFRSAVNPVLLQPKNVRLYLQKMAQVNKQFIARIRKVRDPKTNEVPENFITDVNRFTLESVSVVALDKELGLLKDDNVDPIILKLFTNISEFFRLSGELETKPSLWKIIKTPKLKSLMKALDEVQNVTSHFVNEAIVRLEEEQKNGIERPENEKSVLEKLLKIDRKIATVMAMDMLMAGVDTTTSTFVGIMLCLAKNPDKQAKLREEVRQLLPTKDSDFTESSLNNMPYLRACIKESMRIYPLTVGNGRVVERDVVIGGYKVPKGTQVITINSLLSDDERWYSRPNEFLPERWLRTAKDDTGGKGCPNELKVNHPFVFLPFGFGARSCIGRRIAEMELELVVARVVRNFNVAYNYPCEQPFAAVLINVPIIPLKFEFTEIEN